MKPDGPVERDFRPVEIAVPTRELETATVFQRRNPERYEIKHRHGNGDTCKRSITDGCKKPSWLPTYGKLFALRHRKFVQSSERDAGDKHGRQNVQIEIDDAVDRRCQ